MCGLKRHCNICQAREEEDAVETDLVANEQEEKYGSVSPGIRGKQVFQRGKRPEGCDAEFGSMLT